MIWRSSREIHAAETVKKSTGGIVFPIVFRHLQPTIGFGWATRVIAFMSLGMLVTSIVTMHTRMTPKSSRAMLGLPAFREAPFDVFCLGLFLAFIGLFSLFFMC